MKSTIKKIGFILIIYSILRLFIHIIFDKLGNDSNLIIYKEITLLILNLSVALFYYFYLKTGNKANFILIFLSVLSPGGGGMMIIFYKYLEFKYFTINNQRNG